MSNQVILKPSRPTVTVNTTGVLVVNAGPGPQGPGASSTDLGAAITSAANQAVPADTDKIAISDGTANVLKKLTWANVKAALKTYFDTLYAVIDWANVSNKPVSFTPSPHKLTHATGASDPLSPADIGAAPANHAHPGVYEPVLGTPASDGMILKSTAAGIRSWGAAAGGDIDWANPVAINTATALTIGKHHVISDLAAPANYTITLPAVAGNAGKLISVEMAAALTKQVTVDAGTGVQIDGQQTRVMWAKETAVLKCDGSNWTKIAGKSIPMSATMYKSDGQLFSVNTVTKILLNSVVAASPAALCSTVNNNITALRSGTWQVFEFVTTNGNNTSAHRWQNQVRKNTSAAVTQTTYVNPSGLDTSPTVGTVDVAAGDVIDLACIYMAGSYSTSAIYPGGAMLQILEVPKW